MANIVWGIDIGHAAVKAVKMQRTGNTAEVLDYAVVPIERDEDDMTRPLRVQMALRELISDKKIGHTPVVLSIPGNQAFFRPFNLPPVAPDRVEEIVQYEARQQIPFPLEEVEWGWQHHEGDDQGGEFGVDMVAVRKDIVNQILDAADQVGLKVIGLQSAPLGLYNFIQHELEPKETMVVLDVGAKETDFLIVHGRHWWVRPLQMSGNDVTRLLEQKFRYDFEEAEEVKLKMVQSKQASKIFQVVEPSLRNMASEVQRTLGFYKSLARGVRVSKCLVTGNSSKLMDLPKFLNQSLRMPAERIEELQRIEVAGVDEEELEQDLPGLTVALGLGLQGLGLGALAPSVELLPRERRIQLEVANRKPLALICAAAVVLAVILSYFAASNRLHEIQTAVETAKQANTQVERMNRRVARETEPIGFEELRVLRQTRIARERGWFAHCIQSIMELADDPRSQYFGSNAAGGVGAYIRQLYVSRTTPAQSIRANNADFRDISLNSQTFGSVDYITSMPTSVPPIAGPETKRGQVPTELPPSRPMFCLMVIECGPQQQGNFWQPLDNASATSYLVSIRTALSEIPHFRSVQRRVAQLGLPLAATYNLPARPGSKASKTQKSVYNKALKSFLSGLESRRTAVQALPATRNVMVTYETKTHKADGTTDTKTEQRPHTQNVLYWIYDDGSDKHPELKEL